MATEFAGQIPEYSVEEVYADQGQSWSEEADSRPEFRRLLDDAKAGKFDLLVTTSMDRLTRSVDNLLATIEQLREYGVGYISIHEELDLTGPKGQEVLTKLAASAKVLSSLHSDRAELG